MSELSDTWAEVTIGEINAYKSETLDPSKNQQRTYELYSVPIFPTRKPELLAGKEIGSTKQRVEPEDVLLCKINPRINRVWIVGERAEHEQIASSEWIAIRQPLLDANFIRYQLSEASFRDRLCAEVSGVGGSLTRAQPKKVEGYTIRIAPVAEQKRIAQKLDALLAQVDTLKARIDAIPALLKRFRQSVLASAVSGMFPFPRKDGGDPITTREAKLALGDELISIPTSWTIASLGQVINPLRKLCYGVVQPGAADVEQGVEMVRVCDIDDGQIAWQNLRKISRTVDSEYRRSRVMTGDVVLSIVGSIGRAAIVRSAREVNIARAVARISPETSKASAEWIFYWLSCPSVQWWLISSSKEVARKTLNLKELSELPVPLPPLSEQTEIVRRVEQLFAFADQLEAKVAAARQRIDMLTQSILVKAFRGELVPHDPNDEPASVLLERIRAKRAAAPKPRRGRKAST
ncbi:restriction endonuclease subunit S [Frateuria hangzhouensis]|uniref:restriction endonuclease subunit S n=1 Tax=Frateuria hangzhouensis TaxID=2995589 RepID=UPI002260FBDB|nr:restriction endonuclease subunit S [Frateuria sp. STR12]MCX7512572.1 restriction endonuclease subunit S [Frateuria sp. STR12]